MKKPKAAALTSQEALIYVMVTISAADRAMTDHEMMKIGDVVRTLPVFTDFDQEHVVRTAEACSHMLQDESGLDAVLDKVAETLPPRLYETAYAIAVEVAAADLAVGQEELRFLQMLRDRLELDPLVVAAIERSARVRFRRA